MIGIPGPKQFSTQWQDFKEIKMPWGFGIPKVLKNAYNAMPNLGVNNTVSRAYNSLPSFNPYGFSGGEGLNLEGIGMGGGMINNHPAPPPVDSTFTNPAIIAAQHEPEFRTQVMPHPSLPPHETPSGGGGWGMPSLGGMASGLYNALPSAGSVVSGLAHAGTGLYNALPSAGSVAGTARNVLSNAAGHAASGLGSLARNAATSGISYIPNETRSNLFQNVGGQIGSGVGNAIASQLPSSIGNRVKDYTTNFGKKFSEHLSSQFSNSPRSSFGGFKNVGATVGGGAAGALGGAGLGSVGGSALGGYLGGKLGKYGAPIGKVLGGLLGGGLGALGGGLGGGYLGNKSTGFEGGGRVKRRRSTNKLMYNERRPKHGMPRR